MISDEAYKALVDVLGEEHVSKDPAVMFAYSRTFSTNDLNPPQCVVQPAEVSEIQLIYRLANEYDFKVIPTGTHLMMCCEPMTDNLDFVTIDPKRMDYFEIDEENMVATIGPYVTFFRLQAEAMKRGLTCYIPSGGSQTSVLSNLVYQGWNMQAYRLGAGSRNMLAMEWVTPTGEIMRTGSAAFANDNFFWGEGPGIDLRGMVKGSYGGFGGLGMCTKIGMKLVPWIGPEKFPCEGITPDKRSRFPEDKFRFFTIDFSTKKDVIEAMYEIGHAEIAARLIHMGNGWIPVESMTTREDFFEWWESDEYKKDTNNTLMVVLEAHASPKQLDYEEEVLREIVEEYSGRFIYGKIQECFESIVAPDLFYRPSLIMRGFRAGGSFMSVKLGLDSLDHAALLHKNGTKFNSKLMAKKAPPFLDDNGQTAYINPYDFSHMAHLEMPVIFEASFDAISEGAALIPKNIIEDVWHKCYPGGFLFGPLSNMMGPFMGKFHKYIGETKAMLDPNNVSNPPWPILPSGSAKLAYKNVQLYAKMGMSQLRTVKAGKKQRMLNERK